MMQLFVTYECSPLSGKSPNGFQAVASHGIFQEYHVQSLTRIFFTESAAGDMLPSDTLSNLTA
jgi:hypothetical protein